jgi:hypothetical protein
MTAEYMDRHPEANERIAHARAFFAKHGQAK